MERVNQLGKMEIREVVTVVGQKFGLTIQIFFNRLQTLADIGIRASVHEGDGPVFDVPVEDPDVAAAVQKDKVVGNEFAVIDEIILDSVRAIAQAQDEILVTKMSVVLHHVPQDRPVTDMNDGLGGALARFLDSHADTATEKDDFHRNFTPFELNLVRNCASDSRTDGRFGDRNDE